jgi:hypothetical protein
MGHVYREGIADRSCPGFRALRSADRPEPRHFYMKRISLAATGRD